MLKTEDPKVLTIEKIHPDDQWDAFVCRYQPFFLFSSKWGRTLESGYKKYKARTFAFIFKINHEIICGTIGTVLDFGFIKIFFDQVPYGGLFGQKELFPEFLRQLEAVLKKEGIHQIRITSHYLNRFEPHRGYYAKETCQHVLDLQNLTKEKLWKSYGPTTKWAIKKAMREKVETHSILSVNEIEDYYALFRKTMDRNQTMGSFPKEYFTSIYEHLIRKGHAEIIFATLEGRTIGAKLLMYAPDGVFDYLSVSDEAYFKLRANELLTHQAIEKALGLNAKYFDFGTGYGFGDSLSKFKEKWGAKAYEFHTYVKDFHPWRCRLWDGLWRFANTKTGASMVGALRRMRDGEFFSKKVL